MRGSMNKHEMETISVNIQDANGKWMQEERPVESVRVDFYASEQERREHAFWGIPDKWYYPVLNKGEECWHRIDGSVFIYRKS